MAKCKYILYLPGGGTIELPTNFGLLKPTAELDSFLQAAKTYINTPINERPELSENEDTPVTKLLDHIKPLLPPSIHGNTIVTKIRNSETIADIYNNINELIEHSGTFDTIDVAIKNYIAMESTKGKEYKTIKKLKELLSAERNSSYFKDFGVEGVLGVTSLKDEKLRIKSRNLENAEFGLSTGVTEHLYTIISALNASYNNKGIEKNLYGVRNPLIGKAWSTDDFIIYELDNDLSLFLALFKNVATRVPLDELKPILDKLNSILKTKKNGKIDLETFDINEFFRGKLTDKQIHRSYFEELLTKANTKDISNIINEIILLVSKTIHPDWPGLTNALKILIAQLQPDIYGKYNLIKQKEDLDFVNKEANLEGIFKENRLSFYEMSAGERKNYYGPAQEITGNMYESALQNIVLNKDIVKFPEGSTGAYAIVTHIYDRGTNGVQLYGVYKNTFGTLKNVSHLFKPGELEYRKFEMPIAHTDLNEQILPLKGVFVPLPGKDMLDKNKKHIIVKQVIEKGDTVNGDLVAGIYPSYVSVIKPNGTRAEIYYQSINSFTSSKLFKQIEKNKLNNLQNFKAMIDIKDISNIQVGDYFLFESKDGSFYKEVLFVDENNVYSWVQKDENYVILPTPKEEIKFAKFNGIGELSIDEIKKVIYNINTSSLTKSTLSSFTDKNMRKVGDYFHVPSNDGEVIIGKILPGYKILLSSKDLYKKRTIHSVDFLDSYDNVVYYTSRDISSKYAFFTNRVNTWSLQFKPEAENDLDVELDYIIPIGIDYSNLVTLPNGYLSMGTFVSKKYREANLDKYENYEVITPYLISANGKSSDTKVFGKVTNNSVTTNSMDGDFERNLTSLSQIYYFDQLPTTTKKNLNVLQPGTYFSIYSNESKLQSTIYRIINVRGDIVKAQVNRISETGDLITREVDFSAEALLQSKGLSNTNPPLSISRLFLISGNSKINAALQESHKLSDVSKKELNSKAVNTLIKNLKKYIINSGIKVKVVKHSDVFKNGQYAAIITDENGKTMIAISDELGGVGDVFHEFLHLFLTPLRYKHPQIYNQFIQSIVNDTTINVTDAEEIFVKTVVDKINNFEDFTNIFENLSTFTTGLKLILMDVNPEYDIAGEENPVTLLKTPLSQLFEIDKTNVSHPMYNLGLITTEPMMREWLKKNNITLNCT